MNSINCISSWSASRKALNLLINQNGRVNSCFYYRQISTIQPLKQSSSPSSSSTSSSSSSSNETNNKKKSSGFLRAFTVSLVSFNLGVALALYNPDSRKFLFDYFGILNDSKNKVIKHSPSKS